MEREIWNDGGTIWFLVRECFCTGEREIKAVLFFLLLFKHQSTSSLFIYVSSRWLDKLGEKGKNIRLTPRWWLIHHSYEWDKCLYE